MTFGCLVSLVVFVAVFGPFKLTNLCFGTTCVVLPCQIICFGFEFTCNSFFICWWLINHTSYIRLCYLLRLRSVCTMTYRCSRSNATFMVKPLECFTPLHLQVTVNVPGHLGMTVIFKQMTVFKRMPV